MSEELTRREQIAPGRHAIKPMSSVVVRESINRLGRNKIERLPFRHFLGEPVCNELQYLVGIAWCAVATHPFLALPFSGYAALVDNAVKLLAHLASLRLRLDIVAADYPPAARERTEAVPAL